MLVFMVASMCNDKWQLQFLSRKYQSVVLKCLNNTGHSTLLKITLRSSPEANHNFPSTTAILKQPAF